MAGPNLNANRRAYRNAIATLISGLLLSACGASSREAQDRTARIGDPKAAISSALASGEGGIPGSGDASRLAAAPAPAAPKADASPPPRAVPFSERLLAERPLGTRLPSDFVLGPLAANAEAGGPASVARDFVKGLAERKLDGARVEAAYAPVLSALYGDSVLAFPDALGWRLSPAKEGADASLSYGFALISALGRAEGSIRLYPFGDSWALASLEADFSTLGLPRAESEGDFDPDSYDWPE